MICYYFYKNLVLVATELHFAAFAGFSGQIFFADWLPQLYNSLFTSWPCIFSYLFDTDDTLLVPPNTPEALKTQSMVAAR